MEITRIKLTDKEIHEAVKKSAKNNAIDSKLVIQINHFGGIYHEIEAFYHGKGADIESIKAYNEDSGDEIDVHHNIDFSCTKNSRVII